MAQPVTGQLTRDFVDKHISSLVDVPTVEWDVTPGHSYYQLDLHRCGISDLSYLFFWGDNSTPIYEVKTFTEKPNRILKIDISLNNFTVITHQGLKPLTNVRILDASFNQISRARGLELLRRLHTLMLSHNQMKDLVDLTALKQLVVLHVGNNEFTSLMTLPPLTYLQVLSLNNNKLETIDGLEQLRSLLELHIHKNQVSDLFPLTSCLKLKILNAADNKITSLQLCVEYFRQLPKLNNVRLFGNPIEKHDHYLTAFLSTSISTLDGLALTSKTEFRCQFEDYIEKVKTLKAAARDKYVEQLEERRRKTQKLVEHLENKIATVNEELREYEQNLTKEQNCCMRFIDGLTMEEMDLYTQEFLRNAIERPPPKPWERERAIKMPQIRTPPLSPGKGKHDYRSIKDTDELLRHVYNELANEASPEKLASQKSAEGKGE